MEYWKKIKQRVKRRHVVAAVVVFFVVFTAYLMFLYVQVEQAFTKQEQFVPTRIYSDVTRILPPQKRHKVESRLRSLGYPFRQEAEKTFFKLRQPEYPRYLIPDNHPVSDLGGMQITFVFDGTRQGALLQSIRAGDRELQDLYLEPELVATLSRAGDDAKGAASRQIREPLRFERIPALVWKSIIAVEDQHFLDHVGLDPRGLLRALWINLKTQSFAQGGSTITMQLVKNLMSRRGKNIFRKANEVILALLLEARYSKEQILERYLNEVYLGQVGSMEIHGVAEGAKYFFGKRVEELNLGEIALMAGLIRGPGFYSPYRHKERAIERQNFVLKKMHETGQIVETEARAALAMPLRLAPPQSSANKAPYFTDFVKAELIRQLKDRMSEQEIVSAGFRVYTTLDVLVNAGAQKAVSEGIGNIEKWLKIKPEFKLEGALAAVDHSNGFIRALVGGRNYAQSTFNRILNMKRQVGSTFKPFVFLAAITKGYDADGVPYGPGHPVEDAPWKLVYDRGKQEWSPKNYEERYLGWISYRKALALSVNVAAAKLGIEVGLDNVIKTARAAGIDGVLPAVPSLSLGIAELSPVELLRAYATLANRGVQDELTVIRGITHDHGAGFARFVYHPKEVYPAAPVELLNDMLTSVFTEGTAMAAAKLGFDRPAAGKTGTTTSSADCWFAGFTPSLTAVISAGIITSPIWAVAALNLLTNSPILTPC